MMTMMTIGTNRKDEVRRLILLHHVGPAVLPLVIELSIGHSNRSWSSSITSFVWRSPFHDNIRACLPPGVESVDLTSLRKTTTYLRVRCQKIRI